MRVLLVEDDANLRFGVAAALRAAGLAVDEAVDLPQADEALFVTAYDCAVFVRMLPSGDAADYVEELRRGGRAVPVLFLTARDTVADRVEGFARGGDDYLVKPFAVPELVARVRSLCRRAPAVSPPVLRVGDVEIDTARRQVRRAGVLLTFTRREFAVLEVLATRADQAVGRAELIESCWDEMAEPQSNVLEVLISQLRRKLGGPRSSTPCAASATAWPTSPPGEGRSASVSLRPRADADGACTEAAPAHHRAVRADQCGGAGRDGGPGGAQRRRARARTAGPGHERRHQLGAGAAGDRRGRPAGHRGAARQRRDRVPAALPALGAGGSRGGGRRPRTRGAGRRARPRRPCLTVSTGAVRQAAATAVRADEPRSRDARTADGEPVRMFALPFYPPDAEEDAAPQGALVTVADASAQRADHRRLTSVVSGGCALLVLLSAGVGHLLSGRAVRPALEALDRQESFLADAAHDLRTPAASLRTLAETALRGETDSTDVHRRTLRLAEGMGTLVDGLLTRARLMSGTAVLAVEPLRLDQLVEAVVEDVADEGQRVAVRAERAVVVVADPDLVRRTVANLVGNALVHGHLPGEPAEVEVTVDGDGATTTVTVEDAGPGLPPEVAGALFDRFRSGSGSTGLGLSIASWVAHAHGGSLTAEPGRRGGARFVLRLPAGGPATEG